jgi:hypothetical protein
LKDFSAASGLLGPDEHAMSAAAQIDARTARIESACANFFNFWERMHSSGPRKVRGAGRIILI